MRDITAIRNKTKHLEQLANNSPVSFITQQETSLNASNFGFLEPMIHLPTQKMLTKGTLRLISSSTLRNSTASFVTPLTICMRLKIAQLPRSLSGHMVIGSHSMEKNEMSGMADMVVERADWTMTETVKGNHINDAL